MTMNDEFDDTDEMTRRVSLVPLYHSSQAHDCLLRGDGSRAIPDPAGKVPPDGGPDGAAPRGKPMRAAEDLDVEIVFPDGAHDALDSLAVDGPAREVAEAGEHREGVDEVSEGVEGQVRRLVDVEALQGAQAGGARREQTEVLVPVG